MNDESFAVLMKSVGAKYFNDDYFVKGLIEISFEHTRSGKFLRLYGYGREQFLETDVSAEALAAALETEQEYAAIWVGKNTTLANLIIDQYKDAPFDLTLRQDGLETKLDVHVRQADMEASVKGTKLYNDTRITYASIMLKENGEMQVRSRQNRVGRRQTFVLKYDPVAEPDRFLAEVMPYFESDGEGVLRKATVSYGHSFTGDHETVTEWYEVFPFDEVARSILNFKNCKRLLIDTIKIQQVVSRDMFGAMTDLYDYHRVENITETVFAFRLPDDFEPNGRTYAEISIVGPNAVG